MIESILGVSKAIEDNRSLNDVFTYVVEEVGELATEINIHTGYSCKKQGKDGIVGEAIDAIICLVDIIRLYNPTITEDELTTMCNVKLQKWVDKSRR